MFPINGDTLAALFVGIMLGVFLVALAVFMYGLVAHYRADRKSKQLLRAGLQEMREQV